MDRSGPQVDTETVPLRSGVRGVQDSYRRQQDSRIKNGACRIRPPKPAAAGFACKTQMAEDRKHGGNRIGDAMSALTDSCPRSTCCYAARRPSRPRSTSLTTPTTSAALRPATTRAGCRRGRAERHLPPSDRVGAACVAHSARSPYPPNPSSLPRTPQRGEYMSAFQRRLRIVEVM